MCVCVIGGGTYFFFCFIDLVFFQKIRPYLLLCVFVCV